MTDNAETTTEGSVKTVRDFIYVDVPRLYSLYSQVFEGVTDRIVEERINQAITGEIEKAVLSGASVESQALEASRRTESIVLYDHMYNRLERELGPSLLSALDVEPAQMPRLFADNPMVKVNGRSEIEDYERLQSFIDQFNDLAKAIAYAAMSADPAHQRAVLQLAQQIANETNNANKKTLQGRFDRLTDATQQAMDLNMLQDPIFLSKLKVLSDMINPSGYEIMITPPSRPHVHYRGVIDRNWLRYSPQSMRSMYGGQSAFSWIMVGTVTHSPGTNQAASAEVITEALEEITPRTSEEREAHPMMLDQYRAMFRAARNIESMFLESDTEIEVVISPLAVYREFQLPVKG